MGFLDVLGFWGTSMCCSLHSFLLTVFLSAPLCFLFSNCHLLISDAGCHGLWASMGLFCQSGHLWILFRSKSGSGCVERVSIMCWKCVCVGFLDNRTSSDWTLVKHIFFLKALGLSEPERSYVELPMSSRHILIIPSFLFNCTPSIHLSPPYSILPSVPRWMML